MEITHKQVVERLEYDPDTGVFTRKMRTSNSVRVGDVAGYLRKDGYRGVRLFGKEYLLGRLAFFVVHRRWPTPEVDHINGDRSDDRIANLREVTRRQNNQNYRCHREGKLLGAVLMKDQHRNKPWRGQIRIDGKFIVLGYFKTEQEAHQSYMKALKGVA